MFFFFKIRLFFLFFVPIAVILFITTAGQIGVARVKIQIDKKREEFMKSAFDAGLFNRISKSCRHLHIDSDDEESAALNPLHTHDNHHRKVDRFAFVFGILSELGLIDIYEVRPLLQVFICTFQ